MKSAECAVYVATCDVYSDLWPGFFHCFHNYWPDCPFDVYLGANELVWPEKGVMTLKSAPATTWSERLMVQLGALSYEYVLVVLEDFYLRSVVNTGYVLELLAYLREMDGAALRLIPRPPPQTVENVKLRVGECLEGLPYRVCTQAALWHRETLLMLLRREENIWQFEHNVQERAKGLRRRFYAVGRPALPYQGKLFHHVVEKGRWIPSEYVRCLLRGIPCGRTRRTLLSPLDFLLLATSEAFGRLLTHCFGGDAHLARRRIRNAVPDRLWRGYQSLRKY